MKSLCIHLGEGVKDSGRNNKNGLKPPLASSGKAATQDPVYDPNNMRSTSLALGK